MATKRLKAYQDVLHREPKIVNSTDKLSDLYCENVFHKEIMREYLPSDTFKQVMKAIDLGDQLDRKIADQIDDSLLGIGHGYKPLCFCVFVFGHCGVLLNALRLPVTGL